jgi:hypothetical protein
MYLTTSTYTPCSLPSTKTTTTTTTTTTTAPVRSRTNSFLLRRPLLLISTTQIGNPLQRDLSQQHYKLHNSSERKSANMMQPYIYSREQQQQQQQQQPQQQPQPQRQRQQKSSGSFQVDQLSADRVSDFSAQMACYLWFCENIDQSTSNTPGGQRRYSDFRPRDAFKKFCRDVISATQVSHSVILLSLLYIYRMKINNPAIQGHPGSEFRTFTVALMLANKFLDDNTYTNKTWSEVTNISVREINIMEIEFLDSLNFSLYVSEKQYFDWVRTINQLVSNDHDDPHYRDPRAPADCSIALSRSTSSLSTVPQESYNVAVPMDTTISPRSFKRSAEQAFVDTGMITSPPKRTALYPVYAQSQSTVPSQSRQVPTFQSLSSQPTPTTTTNNNNNNNSSSAPIFYQLSSSFNLPQQQQPSSSSNYELSTTKFIIQNVQHQYVMEQMQLLYAQRSNYFNSRSATIGFHPLNNVAFQQTVV